MQFYLNLDWCKRSKNKSLADKALLDQISKVVTDSADNVKRASVEASDEQLREIKKLRREEPKPFKRKGNKLQYTFNAKLQVSFEEAKSHLQINAIDKAKEALTEGTSSLAERQKLILLADKSDFGWKTVDEYVQHELAVDEEDGKKIVVQKKGLKRRSSPRFQERRQGGLFFLPSFRLIFWSFLGC